MPRRLAAIFSVGLGLGLIAASAEGVLALDAQLEAATTPTVPARLQEDYRPSGHDGRCRNPEFTAPRSPEV